MVSDKVFVRPQCALDHDQFSDVRWMQLYYGLSAHFAVILRTYSPQYTHSNFLYFAFIDLLNSISSLRVGLPLVSSFVVLIEPFARNNDSKSSLPKIFIAQNVPRKASPAPTVFVTLKPFPATFIVGIDLISSFFPKIQPSLLWLLLLAYSYSW